LVYFHPQKPVDTFKAVRQENVLKVPPMVPAGGGGVNKSIVLMELRKEGAVGD